MTVRKRLELLKMTTEECQVDKIDLNINELGDKQFAYFIFISHAINLGIIVNKRKHCKTVFNNPQVLCTK